MKIKEFQIKDCYEIENLRLDDNRGFFCKLFHEPEFKKHNIYFPIKEIFYSKSTKNVIRGMHFQTPPNEIDKIVVCTRGKILDVFLDIRKDSKTYGKSASCIISEQNAKALYLPKGIAHGFLCLSEDCDVLYLQSEIFSPESDSTIHWNSFGFDWEVNNPILSEKDNNAITFTEYGK